MLMKETEDTRQVLPVKDSETNEFYGTICTQLNMMCICILMGMYPFQLVPTVSIYIYTYLDTHV